MSHCLRLLKVPMVQDFDLLQDSHCDFGEPTVPCTSESAVAFHPLRTPAEYNECRDKAEAQWKELQLKNREEEAEKEKEEEKEKEKEQRAQSEKKHSTTDAEHGEARGKKRQQS